MPVAADIQQVEDAALALARQILSDLRSQRSPADVQVATAVATAMKTALDLAYTVENQRAKRTP